MNKIGPWVSRHLPSTPAKVFALKASAAAVFSAQSAKLSEWFSSSGAASPLQSPTQAQELFSQSHFESLNMLPYIESAETVFSVCADAGLLSAGFFIAKGIRSKLVSSSHQEHPKLLSQTPETIYDLACLDHTPIESSTHPGNHRQGKTGNSEKSSRQARWKARGKRYAISLISLIAYRKLFKRSAQETGVDTQKPDEQPLETLIDFYRSPITNTEQLTGLIKTFGRPSLRDFKFSMDPWGGDGTGYTKSAKYRTGLPPIPADHFLARFAFHAITEKAAKPIEIACFYSHHTGNEVSVRTNNVFSNFERSTADKIRENENRSIEVAGNTKIDASILDHSGMPFWFSYPVASFRPDKYFDMSAGKYGLYRCLHFKGEEMHVDGVRCYPLDYWTSQVQRIENEGVRNLLLDPQKSLVRKSTST